MSAELIQNIVLITFLGILLAFNPMLLVVDVLLVLRSKRPILNSIILTAGFVSAILLMLAIAGALVDPDSQISLSKISGNLRLPPLVQVLAGGLLIGYAAKRYRDKPSGTPSKQIHKIEVPQKPHQIFLFGFLKTPFSATNIFAVLILARLAAVNNWQPASAVIAAVWLLLVGIIPLVAVVYYHQYKNHYLVRLNQRIDRALTYDFGNIITIALAIIGAVFAAMGVVDLL